MHYGIIIIALLFNDSSLAKFGNKSAITVTYLLLIIQSVVDVISLLRLPDSEGV